MTMDDHRPTITYAGKVGLIEPYVDEFQTNLSAQHVEWKRDYGRVSKSIQLDLKMIPLKSVDACDLSLQNSLKNQPLLHTYWTDCADFETYKLKLKDDLSEWLCQHKSADWLVVFVGKGNDGSNTSSSRRISGKVSILSRSSVIDKIKSDIKNTINSSQITASADRIFTVQDLSKTPQDTGVSEYWHGLINRTRILLLHALNRTLNRFEETIRLEREGRCSINWCFCSYFILQEELALFYAHFQMFEEALVQYDELDALFTQSIINSNVVEATPKWLMTLTSKTLFDWSGLSMYEDTVAYLRNIILTKEPSFLDFRNYLMAQQCRLLLFLKRPDEVAQRALMFFHNCTYEISVLNVQYSKGLVSVWAFLSANNVLETCQSFCDLRDVSYQIAPIWLYAFENLHTIGEMCGYTFSDKRKSDCASDCCYLASILEAVKLLEDDDRIEYDEDFSKSPYSITNLRSTISTKENFIQAYLELAEFTILNFKRIGRLRSARHVGIKIANFYLNIDMPHKAIQYFTDGLKMFEGEEKWIFLRYQILLDLASCYYKVFDVQKFIEVATLLACSPVASFVPMERKVWNFYELFSWISNKIDVKMSRIVESKNVLDVMYQSTVNSFIPGGKITQNLSVFSHFPLPLTAVAIRLKCVVSSKHKITGYIQNKTSLSDRLVYNEDGIISSAWLGVPRRSANHQVLPDHADQLATNQEGRFFELVVAKPINLICGLNENILLNGKAEFTGFYEIGELCVSVCLQDQLKQPILNVVIPSTKPEPTFSIVSQFPKFSIINKNLNDNDTHRRNLVAGVKQRITLFIETGSCIIPNETCLHLTTSCGLMFCHVLRPDDMSTIYEITENGSSLALKLPTVETPFQNFEFKIEVESVFLGNNQDECVEHEITVVDLWQKDTLRSFPLSFLTPFSLSYRLQTLFTQKYIIASVVSHAKACVNVEPVITGFFLTNQDLKATVFLGTDKRQSVELEAINDPNEIMELYAGDDGVECNYIWKILESEKIPHSKLSFQFRLNYWPNYRNTAETNSKKSFQTNFDICDFWTKYIVKTSVEPSSSIGLTICSNTMCRVNSICILQIFIKKVEEINEEYEVAYEIIADPKLWTLNGSSIGFVKKDVTLIEIVPVTPGLLAIPLVNILKFVPDKIVKNSSETHLISREDSRLIAFENGQIYVENWNQVVKVLPMAINNQAFVNLKPHAQNFGKFSSLP